MVKILSIFVAFLENINFINIGTYRYIPISLAVVMKCRVNRKEVCCKEGMDLRYKYTVNQNREFHSEIARKKHKVLSLLEACFDLISSPSPSMKIQIMGRKIPENLGFKSSLRKLKIVLSFFCSLSKIPSFV